MRYINVLKWLILASFSFMTGCGMDVTDVTVSAVIDDGTSAVIDDGTSACKDEYVKFEGGDTCVSRIECVSKIECETNRKGKVVGKECRCYGDRVSLFNYCVKESDTVLFGRYYQTEDETKMDPLEWVVLKVDSNKVLLLSKYILEGRDYNNELHGEVTWETCTLRKWLNDDFLTMAFTGCEMDRIAKVEIENPNNTHSGDGGKWETNGGNKTKDQIFLLSMDEAKKLFKTDGDRIGYVTAYAEKSIYIDRDISNDDSCQDDQCPAHWWLRSPGSQTIEATLINRDGTIRNWGISACCGGGVGVRPAMWVKR